MKVPFGTGGVKCPLLPNVAQLCEPQEPLAAKCSTGLAGSCRDFQEAHKNEK